MQILGEVMGKTAMYQGLRRMRGSVKTSNAEVRRDAVAGAPGPMPTSFNTAPGPPPAAAMGGVPMGAVPGAGRGMGRGGGPPGGGMPMGPPPNAVFVGVSDGETLWATAPSVPPSDASPGDSSSGSISSEYSGGINTNQQQQAQQPPLMNVMGSQLDSVDWVSSKDSMPT